MSITIHRASQNFYIVNTGVYLSDHTFQTGRCTFVASNVLRFPGIMNRMPFRVTLGVESLPKVLSLKIGETVELGTPVSSGLEIVAIPVEETVELGG